MSIMVSFICLFAVFNYLPLSYSSKWQNLKFDFYLGGGHSPGECTSLSAFNDILFMSYLRFNNNPKRKRSY